MDEKSGFTLILGSTSPRRKQILNLLNMPFETVSPCLEEEKSDSEFEQEIVVDIAREKLHSLEEYVKGKKNVALITADTAVFYQSEQLGKPVDEREAFEMIKRLTGKWHDVYTGVAIKVIPEDKDANEILFWEKTRVKFRKVPDEFIKEYVASGEPLDKAGAYGIQGRGSILVEQIVGDFYNVMGMPIGRIWELLKDFEVI